MCLVFFHEKCGGIVGGGKRREICREVITDVLYLLFLQHCSWNHGLSSGHSSSFVFYVFFYVLEL